MTAVSTMTVASRAVMTTQQNRHFHTRRLLRYALASRLLLLILMTSWRCLVSPYDTSASLNPPCLSSEADSVDPIAYDPSIYLPRIGAAIENSIVWDSVYFTRIAECGYEYEQSYAFLPLLPICIRVLSKTVFMPLVPVIGHRAVLGLSGYILNNIAFVFAALYLFRLSLIILKDPRVAFRASVLFCLNPASIFYSSIYSESLYALLSIGGLYHLMNGSDYYGTFYLALSGSARSNGVLNAGYICFNAMQRAHEAFFIRKQLFLTVKILVTGTLQCLFIFAPFICFQAYGYINLCMGSSADNLRPWCKARLPLLYNYIQSHYWGVGFLRYFQVKQLPNFLLASPILSLALCSIVYYVRLRPKIFLTLGIGASFSPQDSVGSPSSPCTKEGSHNVSFSEKEISNKLQEVNALRLRKKAGGEDLVMQTSKSDVSNGQQYHIGVVILPFILHLSFMVATSFFFMHVQVATRFLSASPPLYWFASHTTGSPQNGKIWGYFIWSYCVAYILLGSLLFSNFYPFT